jgi:hypothetical protein
MDHQIWKLRFDHRCSLFLTDKVREISAKDSSNIDREVLATYVASQYIIINQLETTTKLTLHSPNHKNTSPALKNVSVRQLVKAGLRKQRNCQKNPI